MNKITIPVELEGMEAAQKSVAQLVEILKEARTLADALASDLQKLKTPINSPTDIIEKSISSAIERAKDKPITCTLEIDKKKLGEKAFEPKHCMCDIPGWGGGFSWREVTENCEVTFHESKARFCPCCGKRLESNHDTTKEETT